MQTNASQEVNAASSSDVGRLIDANCGVQEYTINSCVIFINTGQGLASTIYNNLEVM